MRPVRSAGPPIHALGRRRPATPRILLAVVAVRAPRTYSPPSSANMSVSTKSEAEIKRNPHPDFKKVEAERPDWDRDSHFRYTKTASPSWTFGSGANSLRGSTATAAAAADTDAKKHVCIDPYEPGRPAPFNYKLLISGIVPRPIGFVSSQSSPSPGDGDPPTSGPGPGSGSGAGSPQRNLAPFSYFNMVNHDPPLFVLGLASSLADPKDTLRNLLSSRECVVSIVGEDYLEAANAASVDAPYGASEWAVAGLTPVSDCVDVAAPRVGEAVFSVECRLESVREFESRAAPGRKTGCLVVLEGTRFWVREDALNDERNLIAPEVLRPVGRLGGITYGRVTEVVEIPRPRFKEDVGGLEGYEKLKAKSGGDVKS